MRAIQPGHTASVYLTLENPDARISPWLKGPGRSRTLQLKLHVVGDRIRAGVSRRFSDRLAIDTHQRVLTVFERLGYQRPAGSGIHRLISNHINTVVLILPCRFTKYAEEEQDRKS